MSAFRVLPTLHANPSAFFWTSGKDGRLRFLRCQACGYYIHPAAPVCPKCWSRDVQPEPVSGRATLYTFTVNHQKWQPDIEEPYVIAAVQIDEQDDLRLTTNLVDVEIGDVQIGMPLSVRFEDHDPIYVPVFGPVE